MLKFIFSVPKLRYGPLTLNIIINKIIQLLKTFIFMIIYFQKLEMLPIFKYIALKASLETISSWHEIVLFRLGTSKLSLRFTCKLFLRTNV